MDSPERVSFTVDGVPVPQGSATAFPVKGRCVVTATNNKKLKPWRNEIAKSADVGLSFGVAVRVTATFWLPRPKTVKRRFPTTVPDLDKLMRALGDGMKDGGLIVDDSLIVDEYLEKRYADGREPGVDVVVEAME